jgi:transposase InsO family protein
VLSKALDITCSMTARDCWDNAVAESFFASLKREVDELDHLETARPGERDPRQYIDGFYNLQRRHSTIGYKSPVNSN